MADLIVYNTVPLSAQHMRDRFPVFEDGSRFPAISMQYYLDLAFAALNSARWGQWFEMGQLWFAAHFLVLEDQDNSAVAAGRAPGQTGAGIITSKSVGSASISYDVQSVLEDGGGHWNATSYGRRYLRHSRMAGAGGVQL